MIRHFGICVVLILAAGCNQQSASTMNDVDNSETTVAFNVEDAPTVEFSVPDMMCPESCAVKTKEILSEQPGAKEVVVDFDSKTATVAVEDGKFDAAAAIAALVDHGFEHSTVKSDGHPAEAAAKPAEKPAG